MGDGTCGSRPGHVEIVHLVGACQWPKYHEMVNGDPAGILFFIPCLRHPKELPRCGTECTNIDEGVCVVWKIVKSGAL
jgi:hypothetical protein